MMKWCCEMVARALLILPFVCLIPRVVLSGSLPRRISSQVMDLGRPSPVSMVAGMATLIILPGPVTGIRTGNPESIQYFRPDKPENEVTVVLQSQNAKPTNLILRSGRKVYVFDVVPSRRIHQDVLEVVGDFGGAELSDPHAALVDSSAWKDAKGRGQ